ncbi:hypothetical protein K435DRAFT_798461 [Dendrothele bispora CBS 962.96]|uniref:Uncharacterized protein n=1 Tax=Dendrothele bispora (strain CBS 962.96) TaxID=1314807 RepID=A0A4S8LZ63_DENBC|nr:hypothetical protein K435DRAFT_798461 [Dendrothele bispora CBS 962.96]
MATLTRELPLSKKAAQRAKSALSSLYAPYKTLLEHARVLLHAKTSHYDYLNSDTNEGKNNCSVNHYTSYTMGSYTYKEPMQNGIKRYGVGFTYFILKLPCKFPWVKLSTRICPTHRSLLVLVKESKGVDWMDIRVRTRVRTHVLSYLITTCSSNLMNSSEFHATGRFRFSTFSATSFTRLGSGLLPANT